MKSKDVLKLLQITRPTLTKYVKNGTIKTITMPNGQYDYDKDSVYKLFNNGVDRKTYIYGRVSTPKQKTDLENQVQLLKQFCFTNGWCVGKVFQDVASGISFEKRKDFFKLLDEVIQGNVERVVISYKDRMSRVGFELFYHLFTKYNTEIIIMSEVGNEKLDSEEIFEEIISLLHCYSMKLYSKRKKQKIKEVLFESEVSPECEETN